MKIWYYVFRKSIAIFAILTLTLFLLHCPPKDDGTLEGLSRSILVLIYASPGSYTYNLLFDDMNDGTIRRIYRTTIVHPVRGTSVIDKTNYIKKCLQGQVYRSASNDCRGTGASPDWGASKLQFCSTNDRACDMIVQNDSGSNIYVADPTKSPTAISCASDTTSGKRWKLVRELGIPQTSNPYMTLPNALTYMPEMPTGNTNLIWTEFAWSSNIDKATEYYFDSISGNATYSTEQLKNTNLYVLCISQ